MSVREFTERTTPARAMRRSGAALCAAREAFDASDDAAANAFGRALFPSLSHRLRVEERADAVPD